MGIHVTPTNIHWNYFLALENDMANVARYVEFNEDNFNVYSIELAHLLFTASSEFEVVTKQVCGLLDGTARKRNIDDYRRIVVEKAPDVLREKVSIPKFGLALNEPFEKWNNDENPIWWRNYNNVKHSRHRHFNQATLKNALNALAGLFIMLHYHHKLNNGVTFMKDVVNALTPAPTLFHLYTDYNYIVTR